MTVYDDVVDGIVGVAFVVVAVTTTLPKMMMISSPFLYNRIIWCVCVCVDGWMDQ